MGKIANIIFITLFISSYSFSQSSVLAIYSDTDEFKKTISSIQQELSKDFTFNTLQLKSSDDINSISKYLKVEKKSCIILLGNRSLDIYKEYLEQNPLDSTATIQLMALKIESEGIPLTYNTYGISYEVPYVTTLTKLRQIIHTDLNNIGIIYRSINEQKFLDNIPHCLDEDFNIKAIKLKSNMPYSYYEKSIKEGFEILVHQKNVKTIIIPNDNKLLSARLISKVWKPLSEENNTIIITGVNSLVSPEIDFGTYTVIPNPSSLGFQVAELVYELQENNWIFAQRKIEPALALYDILDIKNAKRKCEIDKSKISNVSKVLGAQK